MEKFQINQRVQTISFFPLDIVELGIVKEILLPSSNFITMYRVLMDNDSMELFYETELEKEEIK